ncbi:rhoptry kinase family protein ROP28 [Toxoplasma gondii RUB]|uniref:Rhoptry kinase family protein ROP28 n=10 Tax=Toxoplasma gondii TaxID=5811 RepID=S7UZ62_TOXGG|nr:rhoptry kinase family protein ROP28 [Toxoplasma gondii GT1]KAF4641360.1 rhoptry kinase family protein ROP28 [Toxoplasma gondii]KFG29407.1 rhoptry kinase family protein ROP28 [Toxoplasma gondii p89]KFG33824.1 rhoptry kinase family protein ROP28 [Toxoplasma gondii GAB2-2007-GAL-DOM2]KFG38020.1 rhoptry kinase family protein ROP28 [Toxoplasma gondii FOU]KFG65110.1 rhoptry kinase family protein ROP28 [Toxoplasma gondii RUB]KFH00697.1 rhoptry kinase family protein ROP28 [Toxoplasma gondii VAND]
MAEQKVCHKKMTQFAAQSMVSSLSSPPRVLRVIQLLLLQITLVTLAVDAQVEPRRLLRQARKPFEAHLRGQNRFYPHLERRNPPRGQQLYVPPRDQQILRHGQFSPDDGAMHFKPPANRVQSPYNFVKAGQAPTSTPYRVYVPLKERRGLAVPVNSREEDKLINKRDGLRTFRKERNVPTSASSQPKEEWADPQMIRPLDAKVLNEGKQFIARAVMAVQGKGVSPSFLTLQTLSQHAGGDEKRNHLHRRYEEAEGESDESVIWDTAALIQWMKPSRSYNIRATDALGTKNASGAQQESSWPLSTSSFLEIARKFNNWTRASGFLNTVRRFWPSGTVAKVADDAGLKHNIIWHKLLGVGGIGGVLLLEDKDEPVGSPLKKFAGKILYQLSDPSMNLSQSKEYFYQARNEEIGVASLFKHAALSLHDCPVTATDRMQFLFQRGFVLPQKAFWFEGTTQIPRFQDIVEASPRVVGSPGGEIMRLDRYIIAYPIVGPDLEDLDPRKFSLSAVTYIIYKLTKLMATMQEMNLVHTDIKAENFLARDDGELFAADLSMSIKMEPATLIPCLQGTMLYLDPNGAECAYRRGYQSPRAKRDAYALGVTFYKLICHDGPFHLGRLEKEAMEQTKTCPGNNPLLLMLSGISRFTRKDWVERKCPLADTSLLTIVKLLLDPREDRRWTPLDLVRKTAFFDQAPGI